MRSGQTLTSHFHIETKQHELLGLDLGEGVPRRMLMFGALVLTGWIALLAPVLGTPNKVTFSIYFLPPIFLVALGMQQSTVYPSRRRLSAWAIWARYLRRGHRPVINLGGRAAHRSEYIALRHRASEGTRTTVRRYFMPWVDPNEDLHTDSDTTEEQWVAGQVPAGPPVRLGQRFRLLGDDHVRRAYERTYKKRATRGSSQ